MLDSRSKLPIADPSQEINHRISALTSPSFGWGSLRNRIKLLGLSTAIFLAMRSSAAHRPTTYTASSQLLIYIKQILTGADLAILPGRADLPLVQNQIELLRSGNVLVKLVETLQAESQAKGSSDQLVPFDKAAFDAALAAVRRNLSVRQVGASHVVTVKFTASEPEKAAEIVNKLIRIYLQELSRASDAGSSKAPVLRESYQSLGPSAYLISAAKPPIRADGPGVASIALRAALFGLAVAAVLAILLDAINDTIRSSRQLEYALGLECLGIIPTQANMDVGGGGTELPHIIEGRVLRRAAATLLDASLHGLRTIGVTSAVPGEGTTTLAMGLARVMAASGKRVLVIDGCPENPSISRWAASVPRILAWSGGGSRPGPLDNLVEVQTRLHVLPVAEPADCEPCLISSASLDEIRSVTDTYDFVIVDMPALATGPDARAAALALDGFLLVVKWGATESELVRQALNSAGEAQPKFVGALLNMADEKTMKRYGNELPSDLKVATAS